MSGERKGACGMVIDSRNLALPICAALPFI